MRILPLTLIACGLIWSAGTMAASPAKKDAQSLVDIQQTTDAPASKKVVRSRKPKADDAISQPADTVPVAVRDKSGRFVKKQNPLPVPEKKAPPVQAPAKKIKSAPAAVPDAVESGATARCKDGSFSHSKQHSGSCSRHGGVAQWLAE
ncbi:DUF3761 domain-containing protein [Citrobacter braakii]|uniref:DUF3761 domain-containing protein n=1 Tax=Citrobacter braakii TaxID=57706 RepID=UPI0021CDE743|nr:DUF3761 domain-containing protein [Citrobacter braakii]